MAKKKSSRKKRRQRKTNVPQYAPPTEPQEAVEAAPVVTPVAAQPVAATTAVKSRKSTAIAGIDAIDWRTEYPFVVGDLRGMAVVTALMVVLLLILNFFLD